MAVPAQQPYIRSYNAVIHVSCCTLHRADHISFFRHFWQVVEAVALEGPAFGPLEYMVGGCRLGMDGTEYIDCERLADGGDEV